MSLDQMKPQIEKLLAQRMLARRNLLDFVFLTYPEYEAGWVHRDICRRLQRFSLQVERKESPRLMLLMPPRHGKLLADFTEVFARIGGEPQWTTHGALKPGDEVLTPHFQWTKVIAVSEIGHANMEVEMASGARVVAHPNHEWAVERYQQHGPSRGRRTSVYTPEIWETARMMDVIQERGPKQLGSNGLKGGKEKGPSMYRFYLPEIDPTRLPRNMWPMVARRKRRKNGGRDAVHAINYVASQQGRCIQIAHHNGVYLVTRDFIPTHNSELASIRLPAWHLGRCPRHEIINVGYNLDLPMKFSRAVRDIFRNPEFNALFPDALINTDSQAVEAWLTTKGGGFTAAGVGGGITGKGAHILIIDDPLKNMEEADSADRRELLMDWYLSTAYTRLAPGAGVLCIETFWNDDDLAGRLLKAMETSPEADQFEVVKYPALSEAYEYRDRKTWHIVRSPEPIDDPELELLRPPDTALHEERYSTARIKQIRSNQTPRIWSALYQQNPVPDDGMYFKKEAFRLCDAPPDPYGMRIVTGWDFAVGQKQANDFTVGATILQNERDDIFVLDISKGKIDPDSAVALMIATAKRWGAVCDDYQVVVEDGQIWKSIAPFYHKAAQEARLFQTIEPLTPLTDKMARARPLQGRMDQRRVWFPRHASWLPDLMKEMLRFPAGKHDDQVDALAWAVRKMLTMPPLHVPAAAPQKSWKDQLDALLHGGGSHMSA